MRTLSVKVRCHLELSSYNGWENKFTWLVHLHLSNEHHLMNAMVDLVARMPDDGASGRLVEQWVHTAIAGFLGRNMRCYEDLRLLAWDLVGSALAYADWDRLVLLLLGQVATCDNPFTWTLHNSIINDAHFYEMMYRFMQDASSLYACADMIQAWFREQVDEWFDTLATRRQPSSTVFMLVNNLLQNTYGVVSWEHVARAVRSGY